MTGRDQFGSRGVAANHPQHVKDMLLHHIWLLCVCVSVWVRFHSSRATLAKNNALPVLFGGLTPQEASVVSQQPGLGWRRSEHEVVHLHHHSNTKLPFHVWLPSTHFLAVSAVLLLCGPTTFPLSNTTVRTFEQFFFHISIFPGLFKAACPHLLSVWPTFPGQHTIAQLSLVYSICIFHISASLIFQSRWRVKGHVNTVCGVKWTNKGHYWLTWHIDL